MTNSGFFARLALAPILCLTTATAANAFVTVTQQEVRAFDLGQGGTAYFIQLPPSDRQFGFGRNGAAIFASLNANSNASVGYD
ncbi:MAG: hypothetical protein ACRD3W_29280, partial [Terriglobales bacterium]